MQLNDLDAVNMANLEAVVKIAGKYHDGRLSVKSCDYFGISPSDDDLSSLLEKHEIAVDYDRGVVERYIDEEFQELVVLAQRDDNEYAKMRIAKLAELLIQRSYRNPEGTVYDRDEFFMAAVLLLYDYIESYQRKPGVFFLFLFRKRLINLNTELRDEKNMFTHGMGQYLGKVRRFMSDHEGQYGIIPDEQKIAEGIGISRVSVKNCLWVIRANDAVSLDEPIRARDEGSHGDDGIVRLKDTIADPATEKDYVDSHSREIIIGEIRKLPTLEQAVVFNKFGFFGEPLSRERVCAKLGISRGIYERTLANAIDILYLTLKEYENAV